MRELGRNTLTIIDTCGWMEEVCLDDYRKEKLTIGRSSELSDIVVQDNIVSKQYGSFLLREETVWYADCGSSNGTFIQDTGQKILLDETSGYIKLYDKSVFRIGNLKEPDKMILILYRLETEKEIWKKYILKENSITVERTEKNQIVLRHPGASRLHCYISGISDQYIISDNKSVNEIMVNGLGISRPTPLHDKDLIQIMGYQLIFSRQCIYYKASEAGISLRANHISKFIGKDKKKKQILKDVSCEINGNEFVAIIGDSGAKTTLMNAVSDFEPDFQGNVFCNGIDLVKEFQNLKNIIGFVPQQDTFIRKLSGGQKKRASIAVELLADPKLFFLDEPTLGLDPGTEKNLMLTLSRLSKEQNKTIIMVTHTTENLHLCDNVIFMGSGEDCVSAEM